MTIKADIYGNMVQACRPGRSQNVVVGAASAQSLPFAWNPDAPSVRERYGLQTQINPVVNTTHVRLVANTTCWIAFGGSTVAASPSDGSSFMLVSGTPEYFWVVPGERLAVIQDSAGGTLNIAELVH